MRITLLLFGLLSCIAASAQSRLTMNDNPYIVMNGSVQMVIDNNNANAITTTGSGGNIISESETNIISWHINTATGSYIVPFTTSDGVKIPLTVQITSAGAGAGVIDFSTYGGLTWNNDTYKPGEVTNMTNMGVTNNSTEIIDRFWIIDAHGYTTKPSGNIQFNYDDAEHLAAGNTINEPDLKAERYEPGTDDWEVFPVGGIINTGSNYVTGVPFNSGDFMRTWTLIDQTTHLLPIVLTNFSATCVAGGTNLQWTTASETNSDHFIIAGSTDGIYFEDLADIQAAGNSNTPTSYSYTADDNMFRYYKLSLMNTDATIEELGILSTSCNQQITPEFFAYSPASFQITAQTQQLTPGNYVISIFTLQGQLITGSNLQLGTDVATMTYYDQSLSDGIYIVALRSTDNPKITMTSKVALFH